MFSMFRWPIGRANRLTMFLWLVLGSVGAWALRYWMWELTVPSLELGFRFKALTFPDAYPLWYLAVEAAFDLALLVVAIARLHDIERPGWWLLVLIALSVAAAFPPLALASFVVLASWLALLVWPGTFGRNRYGADPLGWESREQYEAQMQALRDHVRPGKE